MLFYSFLPDDSWSNLCTFGGQFKKAHLRLGTVANAYNLTLGGQGGRTAWSQEFKIILGNKERPYLYKKLKN